MVLGGRFPTTRRNRRMFFFLVLVVAGSVIVNTAMLGAFAKTTGLVSLYDIEHSIASKFSPDLAKRNFEAARRTFDETKL